MLLNSTFHWRSKTWPTNFKSPYHLGISVSFHLAQNMHDRRKSNNSKEYYPLCFIPKNGLKFLTPYQLSYDQSQFFFSHRNSLSWVLICMVEVSGHTILKQQSMLTLLPGSIAYPTPGCITSPHLEKNMLEISSTISLHPDHFTLSHKITELIKKKK